MDGWDPKGKKPGTITTFSTDAEEPEDVDVSGCASLPWPSRAIPLSGGHDETQLPQVLDKTTGRIAGALQEVGEEDNKQLRPRPHLRKTP